MKPRLLSHCQPAWLPALLLALALSITAPLRAGAEWWAGEGLDYVGALSNLPGEALDVKVDGDRAYLLLSTPPDPAKPPTAPINYLAVVDVEDPANPRLQATWIPGMTLTSFDVENQLVYAGLSHYRTETTYVSPYPPYYAETRYVPTDGRLSIYNMSNPSRPRRLGSFTTGKDINKVQVVGSRAFLLSAHSDFQAVNVADPAKPRQERRIVEASSGFMDMQVSQGMVFLAREGGMQPRVDFFPHPKKSTLPSGTLDLPYESPRPISSLAIAGDKLFVDAFTRIYVYNWKLPPDKAELTTINTLASYDSYYYASAGVGYPGSYSVGNGIDGIGNCVVARSRLFVAVGHKGVQVIDAADLYSNDFMRGYYLTPGSARALAVSGDLVFVATGKRGLTILRSK